MGNRKKSFFLILAILLLMIFFAFYFSRKTDNDVNLTVRVEDEDGNVYRTVEIGEQVWLAENLKLSSHSEGESWCYLENEENCEKFGRLYDGKAAMVVCPEGWSLPSNDDWEKLGKYIDKDGLVAKHLKAEVVWDLPTKDELKGLNTYDFRALPGGHYFDENFYNLNLTGYWWSSTVDTHGDMWVRVLQKNSNDLTNTTFTPDHGFSVRCIKN